MFQVAMRMMGNAAAADDACQEAFLHIRAGARLFKAPADGTDDAAARAWLLRVVANAAAMWMRSERRRLAREHHVAISPTAPPSPPALAAMHDIEMLRTVLQELPDAQRLPVILHHLGGQDYESVGKALGISAVTARVRVHRALVVLRSHMARLGVLATVLITLNRLAATETKVPLSTVLRWKALLTSSLNPAASKTAIFGGFTLMTKLTLLCTTLAAGGLIVLAAHPIHAEDTHPTGARITICGVAHALITVTDSTKYDGNAEYATVTTTATSSRGNHVSNVYYVMGGAGFIVAKFADGKTVDVTGTIGAKNDQVTIKGRSIDVAIDGVPIEGHANPAHAPGSTH
jgi:RNA polymerase sigma factor (sigma-70 family)